MPPTIPPTSTADQADTPELWATLKRPLPTWYAQAKFGIFIHWGPYSVPAWAEPSGALGVVPEDIWFTHNAYAEWYYNTIRIPGSPAQQHQAEGLRFVVYYSGGLDWSVTGFPPHTSHAEVRELRPKDAAYNVYAFHHVQDLVRRYSPSVLWNDIEWPDSGKRGGPESLHALFEQYYQAVPDGVVNDRWGDTHHDFGTSEYEYHLDAENSGPWENCRGIGLSFGYNRAEDESQSLDGKGLAKHLTDVVARGGRLLLNVGPTAEGVIPPVQQRALEGLGRWMGAAGSVLLS